jgi:hypothetical protein
LSHRIKGFIVTLDQDLHEEDAEKVRIAIEMLRHVASATPSVAEFADCMARERVRAELRDQLIEVLFPKD